MEARRNVAVAVIVVLVMLIISGASVVQLRAQGPRPLECGPCPTGSCVCGGCNYVCEPDGGKCGYVCQSIP
jgi:hypothetical protein